MLLFFITSLFLMTCSCVDLENSIFFYFHSRINQYYPGPTGKLKYCLIVTPFPKEFSDSAHIVEFKTYTVDYCFRLLYMMSLFVQFR